MNLKHLTDKTLLKDTKDIAVKCRSLTTKLLYHLREIETRKLYSDLGYHSLFTNLVKELGLSEGSASRRISAMKLLSDVPEIVEKIEHGSLTLSHIERAVQVFRKEGIIDAAFKKEVIEAIEYTSTRACERTLSEIEVPGKLAIPASPYRIPITFMLSEEELKEWEDLKDLHTHFKYTKEQLFLKAIVSLKEAYEDRRFKKKSKGKLKSSETRYIPAEVKKEAAKAGVCHKCGSRKALEFHHIQAFALGGKSTSENIIILCRSCNQREAITSKLNFSEQATEV